MSIQPYQQKVPIGTVTVGGNLLPVNGSAAFIRYISQYVFERLGGVDALNNNELDTAINEAALSPIEQPPEPFPDDLSPAMVFMPASDWLEISARLSELDARVAEMTKTINGMQQGQTQ